MMTVTIRELATDWELISRHRTTDPEDAVQRALRLHWGARARLAVDREISTHEYSDWTLVVDGGVHTLRRVPTGARVLYGQVGVTPRDGVSATALVTGRVRVTVTDEEDVR